MPRTRVVPQQVQEDRRLISPARLRPLADTEHRPSAGVERGKCHRPDDQIAKAERHDADKQENHGDDAECQHRPHILHRGDTKLSRMASIGPTPWNTISARCEPVEHADGRDGQRQ